MIKNKDYPKLERAVMLSNANKLSLKLGDKVKTNRVYYWLCSKKRPFKIATIVKFLDKFEVQVKTDNGQIINIPIEEISLKEGER